MHNNNKNQKIAWYKLCRILASASSDILLSKKLTLILLVVSFLFTSSPTLAVTQVDQKTRFRYLPMTQISGTTNDLALDINEKSLSLDLARTRNIRMRINPRDLYNETDRTSSIKLSLYEVVGGERKYVSTQNLTIFKGFKRSRVISMDAGYFSSSTKKIEVDVYDTSSNLINTYTTELTAFNTETQILGGAGVNVGSADCQSGNFDDCQLDYLFQRVTFEAKPQSQISTRIVKGEDGLYKVTIPVPRTKFKFLGRKIRKKEGPGSDTGGGSGGGGVIKDGFGETITASIFQVGDSSTETGTITYNNSTGNNQVVINNQFYFGSDGKLGVGVEDPLGWVHIASGNGSTPSIILNPGTLTNSPIDGAIEFDGNALYFTKGGTRTELGARGPMGAMGIQGPQGPAGTTADLNGANLNGIVLEGDTTINGIVSLASNSRFEGDVNFNGAIFADEFHGRLFNGQVFNGVTANFASINTNNLIASGTVNGASIRGNNATINQVLYGNKILISNNINGSIANFSTGNFTTGNFTNITASGTINGSTLIGDNATVNSTLSANKILAATNINGATMRATNFYGGTFNGTFVGDGSGLTGIMSANGSDVYNITINNGSTTNMSFNNSYFNGDNYYVNGDNYYSNGTTTYNNGTNLYFNNGSTLVFNGGTIEGDIIINGSVTSSEFNTRLFNGDVFNGTIANFTTGNYTTINTTNLTSTGTINGSSLVVDNATINQTLNANKILATTNINGNTANFTTANFTTANITTANLTNLNTSGTVNGAAFDGDFTNGSVLYSNAAGVISEDLGQFYWDHINNRLGLGTASPNSLLTVNGATALRETSAPSNSAGYGKLFVDSSTSNLNFLDANNNSFDLLSALSGGTAAGGSNTQFQFNDSSSLSGNGALTFTKASKTLTVAADAPLDIQSASLSIADTNISLTGATTTFTQTGATGTITLAPKAGANLNVSVSGAGDFVVNTNQLYVDSSNARIGLGTVDPAARLDVGNGNPNYIDGINDLLVADDIEVDGDIYVTDTSFSTNFNGTSLNLSGRAGVNKLIATGSVNGNTANFSTVNTSGTVNANKILVSTNINGATMRATNFYGGIFNGTFVGDGSGLTGIMSDNGGSVYNITINNGSTTNMSFNNSYFNGDNYYANGDNYYSNGTTTYNNGTNLYFNNGSTLVFNGGTIEGDIIINGSVTSNEFNARLFNGEVFNGTIANFTTGNYTTINTTNLTSTGTINGSNLVVDNATINQTLNANKILATTNINGNTANFTTANFTTANLTTANLTNLNASGTVNGTAFDGDFTNGSVLYSNAAGVISEDIGQFYWDHINNRLGLGTASPNSLLTVNGVTALRETSAPSNSAGYGKLFVDSTTSNLNFLDANNNSFDLLSALSGGTAAGGSNTQFQFNDSSSLSGNGALTFTKASKTLTVAADAPLDIQSASLSIADTNISLTGATTTFTQTGATGTITLAPKAGANLNVTVSGAGDFVVNTNQLYVDSSNARVGINDPSPAAALDIGNGTVDFIDGTNDLLVADDIEVDDDAYIAGSVIATNFNGSTVNLSGTANVAKLLASGSVNGNTANFTKVLATGSVNGAGANFSSVTSSGTVNASKVLVTNNINGATMRATDFIGGTFNGAVIADSVVMKSGGIINGAILINSNIAKLVAPDGSPNPALSVDNNGQLIIPNSNGNMLFTASSTRPSDAPDIIFQNFSNHQKARVWTNPNGNGLFLSTNDDNPDIMIDASGFIGIGHSSPSALLDVGNGTVNFIDGTNDLLIGDDIEVDDDAYIAGSVIATNFNGSTVNLSGTANVAKLLASGSVNGNTANFTKVLATGSVNGAGANFSSVTSSGTVNASKVLVTNNINGATMRATNFYGGTFNGTFVGDGSGLTGSIVSATGNATTLDNLDSSQFLRSDSSDSYTSGTLTFDSGTSIDINSTNVSIADTDISFDGASTTFTQTSGAITLAPANGSNMNITLLGGSDFVVDTNKLIVDNNGNIGFSISPIASRLTINGDLALKHGSAPTNQTGYGKLFVDSSTSNLNFLDANNNSFDLLSALSGGTAAGGSNTQFQFNDSSSLSGNGALTFTKASKTLTVAADAPLDIQSTSLSIADTNISLTGATTTFTQTGATGTITLAPKAGANLNVSVSGAGDFVVNTNQLYVDSSNARVGINDPSPSAALDIGNGTVDFINGTNDLLVADDIEVDDDAYIAGSVIATNFNGSTVNLSGTANVAKLLASGSVNGNTANFTKVLATGSVNGNTANFTKVLATGSVNGAGANFSSVTALGTVNASKVLVTNNINGVTMRATNFYGGTFNGTFVGDGSGLTGGIVSATGNATTLDNLDSSQFLRSDSSDSYTSGTLTFDSGTSIDINSTNVSIADTDISFDGASTTFTQTSGAITLAPANGSNMNISLLGASDFVVDSNKFIVNNNGNVGIGYTTPNQLFSVNGAMSIKEGSAPSATNTFSKIYANSSNSKLYFMDDSGTSYNLANGSDFSAGDYLRSNTSTAYTSGTLTINSGTTFDINSTNVSIADTDVSFDGGSTTLTSSGAWTMTPANGSNMNINLLGTSDFAVDTNKLFVDNNGSVGIMTTTPAANLNVNGDVAFKPSTVAAIANGSSLNPTKTIMRIKSNGGAKTMSASPKISTTSVADGQILILKGESDTDTLLFDHGGGLNMTDGVGFTLGNGDILQFIYDAADGEWIETLRSNK